MLKKFISIILPSYNEEKNISLIYQELKKVLWTINEKYDYEIIYVNDGSKDNTWREIEKLALKDKNVKWINLSRNFGHQAALTAGLEKAIWDVIVSMDCDMQHPPKVILKMLKKYEEWNDIVYARVLDRNVWFFKKHTATMYYKFLSKISDTDIPRNVWDFRLINKKVLNAFKKLKEKDKYIRGIFGWLWFKYDFVDFKIPKRIYWKSSYTLKKMIKLAMDWILNFSMFPLRIWMLVGTFAIILSFLFFIYMFYDATFNNVVYPLFKWLSVLGFWFMWLQFIFMWIIWEYIWRIYNETRDRPVYIIRDELNFKK